MSKYLKIGHKFQDGTYSHSPLGRHSSAAVSTVASQHGAMDILCKSSCNHKNKVGTVLYLMSNLSAEFLASPHLVLTVHFSVLCSYFIDTFPLIRRPPFCLFMPSSGQHHLLIVPPPPLPFLYFQVSRLSYRWNELNLSPTVQTTADRVRTCRKINRSLPVAFGDWTRVRAREMLMRLRGQMRNRPVPKRHSGSFINMSSSQRLLKQERSRQMMLIILSSPVVRLGALHCPYWAPDAAY